MTDGNFTKILLKNGDGEELLPMVVLLGHQAKDM